MARVLVVATAGAGGDLQPLIAAALAVRDRGHEVSFVGDRSVQPPLSTLGIEVEVLSPELDLGPRLIKAIREAMEASGGDPAAAGPAVQRSLAEWAEETSVPVAQAIEKSKVGAVVTSLFGVEVLQLADPSPPWAVINSTFYIGTPLQRPAAEDFGPRAIPLILRYASLLDAANLVLHATDQVFDYGFTELPERHHYVGPLGIWEPPGEPPPFLSEDGDPWVLVTISSQMQDDIPLAQTALAALAGRSVRVLLTVGPDHDPAELKDIPANAHVERTVSHAAVLQRGSMLLAHAGHGSVMKALWYGQPMVLVPWGRDQPGVAARAAALGVAEVVPRDGADQAALSEAVDKVFRDDEIRARALAHSSRLRTTDPPGVAASLIEGLV